MRSLILKSKHWQLGLPPLLFSIFVNFILRHYYSEKEMLLGLPMWLMILAQVFYFVVFFTWLWHVYLFLCEHRPDHLPSVSGKFQLLYFGVVTCFIVIFALRWMMESAPHEPMATGESLVPISMGIVGLIVLVFLLLPALRRLARMILEAEAREEVKKSKAILDTYLILFLIPLGIWFIQPRINKIYEHYKNDEHIE